MTLRIDKIEIQQQPERKRFWAEAEVYCDSGFRRKQLTTALDLGRDAIFDALKVWCDELDPPKRQAEDVALDALRAEAEAYGVRVDGRWGEARLREEIASVRHGDAAQDA